MLEIIPTDAENVSGQSRDWGQKPDIAELQSRMHIPRRKLAHFRQALRTRLNQRQHGPAIEPKRNLGLMGGMGDIDHVPLRADEAETGMALFVGISEKTQS
jgi:hypothetical protein